MGAHLYHLKFIWIKIEQNRRTFFFDPPPPSVRHNEVLCIFIPRRRYIYVCPGVHLSILIFIFHMGYENWDSKIPLVIALFWALKIFIMDGWWMESFFFFFFLDTYIRYSTCIGIYIYLYNFVWKKVLWVLKFGQVGEWVTSFSKLPYSGQFLYFWV